MEIFNKLTEIYKYINDNNININNIIKFNDAETIYVTDDDIFYKFITDITNRFINLKKQNNLVGGGGGINRYDNNNNNIVKQNINNKDISNYTEYYNKYLINDNINTFKYNTFLEEHEILYLNNYLITELTTIINNFNNIYNDDNFIIKKDKILKDINYDYIYIKEKLRKKKLTNKEKDTLKFKKKNIELQKYNLLIHYYKSFIKYFLDNINYRYHKLNNSINVNNSVYDDIYKNIFLYMYLRIIIYSGNLIINDLIYKKEKAFLSSKKTVEISKIFSNKLNDIKLHTTYFENILNNNKYSENHIEQIKFDTNSIILPKLNEDIKPRQLTKILGLTNIDIAKIINSSNLKNIHIYKGPKNALNLFNLKNQIYFNHRLSKSTNIDKKGPIQYYGLMGVNFNINNNSLNITVNQNMIFDITFDNIKYLKETIINTKSRYVFLLGSINPFKKNKLSFFSNVNITGGHRCGMFFDKYKQEIIYYDALFDYKDYIFTDIFGNNILNYIQYIIKYYFQSNDSFFKKYTSNSLFNYGTQKFELQQDIDLIKTNLLNKYKNKNNIDWGVGYCGLWVILTLLLLEINNTEIYNIYYFFNLLNYEKSNLNKTKQQTGYFSKLLIRSFAYQLENIMFKHKPISFEKISIEDINKYDDIKFYLNDPYLYMNNNNVNNLQNPRIIKKITSVPIYVKLFFKEIYNIFLHKYNNIGNINIGNLNNNTYYNLKQINDKIIFINL